MYGKQLHGKLYYCYLIRLNNFDVSTEISSTQHLVYCIQYC